MRSLVKAPQRSCVFEYVYFARPDSQLAGRSVYDVRKAFGATLAKEHPIDADVVIPVPDSGVPAAIGYASERRIPFEMGLIRSHYEGDFRWESRRLGRVVTLSARLEDNGFLEEFLMREFFGTPLVKEARPR